MAVDPIRSGDPHVRVAGARTHALFEEHARMVYGLCRALLRDPVEAEDAVQATFVSAYRSLLAGTAPFEPAAWLATIARNECGARARARMREPLPLRDEEIAGLPGPEDELERRAAVEELRQAIAGLPERQREAVVLRDLYGLPYADVGAALGLSVASVESLLFRARRQLRVSLKPVAGGVLSVPLAVREGIAQAVPAFGAAGAAGGGSASGALGLGMIAKLASGSAAMKAIAGAAAAVTAGTIAVAGVEQARRDASGPSTVAPVAIGVEAVAAAVTSVPVVEDVPLAASSRRVDGGAARPIPHPNAGDGSEGSAPTPGTSLGSDDGGDDEPADGSKGSGVRAGRDDLSGSDDGSASSSTEHRGGREGGAESSVSSGGSDRFGSSGRDDDGVSVPASSVALADHEGPVESSFSGRGGDGSGSGEGPGDAGESGRSEDGSSGGVDDGVDEERDTASTG